VKLLHLFGYIIKEFGMIRSHIKWKCIHSCCRWWYDERGGQNVRIEPCQCIIRQHV